MKYKNKSWVISICLIALLVVYSIPSTASSLENSEITKETSEQNITEQEEVDVPSEIILSTEDTTKAETVIEERLAEKETKENEESEEINDMNIQSGKYYFFQKYLYDCNAIYLEKYIDYLELQVSVCKEMYQLGEITEANLKSYQAQKALAEAELEIAKNESAYNNLYLETNGLDYSESEIKEIKQIESVDYYIENYPKKDYMTIARYVTNYNNAAVEIQAKQTEITTLNLNVKMAETLLQEGEISKLEYVEKEVSLAKAQYELEQYYVELNVAYLQLTLLCE